MNTQRDPSITPSILCDELGCKDLASWEIRYELDGREIVSFTCDCHVGENCNPDAKNLVEEIAKVAR